MKLIYPTMPFVKARRVGPSPGMEIDLMKSLPVDIYEEYVWKTLNNVT